MYKIRKDIFVLEEIWKDIDGYNGLYQISNLGNVKSFNRGKEKLLKLTIEKKGYSKVGLNKNGKLKTVRVHRLVAHAFIPNPNNLPEVNHKDENKSNNIVDNLEWCNSSYNNSYGTKMERTKIKLKQYYKLKNKENIRIRMNITQKSLILNIILLNMLFNLCDFDQYVNENN